MFKTILFSLCFLALTPNVSSFYRETLSSETPYAFHVSANILCPGSTDSLLSNSIITYTLQKESSVIIRITQEKEPVTVIHEKINQAPGDYAIAWDGRNNATDYIKDGLYEVEFYISDKHIKSFPVEIRSLIAKINVPKKGALTRGQVPIFGIACGRNFKKYIVEYRKKDYQNDWKVVEKSTIPKVSWTDMEDFAIGDETIYGNLATWDTGLTNYYYYDTEVDLSGPYLVRLTVLNEKGTKAVDELEVDVGRVISFIYGGIVESHDKKIRIEFAEHVIKRPFILFNIKEAETDILDNLSAKEGYKLISKIYEIEPEGINFARPAFLTMHYDRKNIQDENSISIYAYEPNLGFWRYIQSEHNKKDQSLVGKIFSTQDLYAYYAIFERVKSISLPTLYELPRKIQFNVINIHGEAEPGQKVKIYINGEEAEEALCNEKTGIFKSDKILLDNEKNKITARIVDEFGNLGPCSDVVAVSLNLKNPKKIYSIKLKDCNFKEGLGIEQVGIGDSLFIELKGEDGDKDSIDATYGLIRNSLTNSNGIKVLLLETGYNTGTYRTVLKLSTETDLIERTLAICKTGDVVIVSSVLDPQKFVTLKTRKDVIVSAKTTLFPNDLCLCQNTFEENFGEWKNLDGEEGAFLSLDNATNPDKSFCLKLTNKKHGGSFGAIVRSTPFNIEEYPIVSFDYKIPADVKINLLIKAGKRWYDIQLTDDDKIYERINMVKIGGIDNITYNNEWHSIQFNLYEMLKRYTDQKIIKQIIIADYDVAGFMKLKYGRNPEGATYYVDNFVISKQLSDTPSLEKQYVSWEIGDYDDSNNEFLYEGDVGNDYYVNRPFEEFERAITRSDPRTNIHFYLSRENLDREYNFYIKAKNWDVHIYDYVDFEILLNEIKIASLKCPYEDGTIFNVKVDKGLKEGQNTLSFIWKGGGDWISWDYIKFEPLSIEKASSYWEIGYDDNSFKEFSHEINMGNDYFIGEDFRNFERAISVQDPTTNIKFYLQRDMLDDAYQLLLKPYDIAPIDIQPKISGVFFRILVNGNEVETYNVKPRIEPLNILISKDMLRKGENTITLEWLAGCDWIGWDYIKFGHIKE